MSLPVRGGLGEIHLWTLDPSQPDAPPRRLTDGLVRDGRPDVSPDGRWLAFERVTADDPVRTHIWLRPLPDGAERQLTHGAEGSAPFWSADGRLVGFTRIGGGRSADDSTLYTVAPFDTVGPPKVLLPHGPAKQLQGRWHPRGGDILFATLGSGRHPYALWRAALSGTRVSEVIPSGCCGVQSGTYSPDGSRIAYFSGTHGEAGDIYVANADGGGQTRVTCESGWTAAGWSPAGDALLMIRRGEPGLWRAPAPPPGGSCVHPTVRVTSLPVFTFTWARLATP